MSDRGDIHGKNQLVRSVVSSWGGQIVLIVSGFLVPRLIDRGLGQDALGVWDFAWSLISHFGLIQAGVTGSINRYVAQHRSRNDMPGLNRAVSSVAGVLRIMGAAILLLTLICAWVMPMLLRESLLYHLNDARWLILLLGGSLAVQVSASVYGGVLTGCHRWDWHNGVYAVTYALMLGGMIAVLKLGYGLIGLAAVNLCGETLGRLARIVLAYRVCPELEIARKHMAWSTAREMLGFGGKMFMYDCAYLLLSQTVSVLILAFLGPASLALFSRPAALVRTVKTFMHKYANVFVPTASSLQSAGDSQGLSNLALSAGRYGLFFSLPPMLFLIILGGDVLRLWMGDAYVDSSLTAMLVAANFFSIANAPLFFVVSGLNRHGRVGLMIFLAALFGAGMTFIWLALFKGTLLGVATCLGIPWILVNGIYLPSYTAKCVGMSFRNLLFGTWPQPLLCCVPFAGCLVLVRWLHPGTAWQTLSWGAVAGGLVLVVCYWSCVVPVRWKVKLSSYLVPRRV